MTKNYRFIITTSVDAERLRALLGANGIEAQVEELAPQNSVVVTPGITSVSDQKEKTGRGEVLIPVDFSTTARLAVSVGFRLALNLGLTPVILHAYSAPVIPPSQMQFGTFDSTEEAVEEAMEVIDVRKIAERKMRQIDKLLRDNVLAGTLPDLKFRTQLLPGVPEEVILEYCRVKRPALVVMATRGVNKKGSDLIGSVTAEVIDSCRVPVLTVPENYVIPEESPITNAVIACSMDGKDIIAAESFFDLFHLKECKIYLVPVIEKNVTGEMIKQLNAERAYIQDNNPGAIVESRIFDDRNFKKELDEFIHHKGVGLMVVPNKKTSIFRRIFRPTVAHRFLFEKDLPLLALPV